LLKTKIKKTPRHLKKKKKIKWDGERESEKTKLIIPIVTKGPNLCKY